MGYAAGSDCEMEAGKTVSLLISETYSSPHILFSGTFQYDRYPIMIDIYAQFGVVTLLLIT